MMKWDANKKVMVMDLMDLEHCGFNHEEYLGELHLHGIDDKGAEDPFAILVNFAGGHALFGNPTKEKLDTYKQKNVDFQKYIKRADYTDMDLIE